MCTNIAWDKVSQQGTIDNSRQICKASSQTQNGSWVIWAYIHAVQLQLD